MDALLGLAAVSIMSACGSQVSGDQQITEAASVKAIQQEVEPTEEISKYTVRLRMLLKDEGNFTLPGGCTGTLYGERYVITADHCAQLPGLHKIFVKVGAGPGIRLEDGSLFSDVYTVERVAIKRSFGANSLLPIVHGRKDRLNDTAVLKLSRRLDLPYTLDYQIYPDKEREFTGEQLIIAGFGIGTKRQIPYKFRKSTVEVIKDDTFRDVFWYTAKDSVRPGDSGGPAWFWEDGQLYLTAVTSFLRFLPPQRAGSVDIRDHVEWIEKAIEKMDEDVPVVLESDDLIIRDVAEY